MTPLRGLPQALKRGSLRRRIGTSELVPFPNRCWIRLRPQIRRGRLKALFMVDGFRHRGSDALIRINHDSSTHGCGFADNCVFVAGTYEPNWRSLRVCGGMNCLYARFASGAEECLRPYTRTFYCMTRQAA